MTNIPKFEFGKTNLTEDQFKKAVEASSSSGNKFFGPGNYTLKTTEAKYHENKDTKSIYCAKDPTWFNVSVKLVGADGREKLHFIQVPTRSPLYTSNGNGSAFSFTKLAEFMSAIGVYMDFRNYAQVVQEYFGSPAALEKLNDLDVNLDIGYKGPFAEYVAKGKYQISINGTPYAEAGAVINFPDKDSAVAFAAQTLSKKLETFPEILRFHPGKAKPAEVAAPKTATGDGW